MRQWRGGVPGPPRGGTRSGTPPGGYPGQVPPPGGGYPGQVPPRGVPRSGTPPGGYPAQVPPGGVPGSGTPPGGVSGSGSPPGGGTQVRYPPGGVPGSGTPPGGDPAQVPPLGGDPGQVPPPPGGGTRVGHQKEYSLHGGRYASCVHAGGLSRQLLLLFRMKVCMKMWNVEKEVQKDESELVIFFKHTCSSCWQRKMEFFTVLLLNSKLTRNQCSL